MSYARQYVAEISELIQRFMGTQERVLEATADSAASRVADGGRLHHFDTGHMKEEPIRRAGGFLGLHHIELRVAVEHTLPAGRDARLTPLEQAYVYDREDLAPLLIEKSHVEAGDVLIQVSNSGKEPFTVGVGLEAKKRGALLVVLTSVDFSNSLEPKHSSGHRLHEIADHVIDMGAPLGDAILEIDGIDAPVAATSGTMTAVALWCLMAELAGALAKRGMNPAIYQSVNLPGGFEHNRRARAAYERNGI